MCNEFGLVSKKRNILHEIKKIAIQSPMHPHKNQSFYSVPCINILAIYKRIVINIWHKTINKTILVIEKNNIRLRLSEVICLIVVFLTVNS